MPFFNTLNDAESMDLSGLFVGTVVSNDDPAKLYRIKVRVPELYSESKIKDDDLPWAAPIHSIGLGNVGWYSVPEVGSKVFIVFFSKSIYAPFYVGSYRDSNNIWHELDANYPDRYGWVDTNGTYILFDKKDKWIEIFHTSGTRILMNSDGDVSVDVVGSMYYRVAGDFNLIASGNVNMQGSEFHWNDGSAQWKYSK